MYDVMSMFSTWNKVLMHDLHNSIIATKYFHSLNKYKNNPKFHAMFVSNDETALMSNDADEYTSSTEIKSNKEMITSLKNLNHHLRQYRDSVVNMNEKIQQQIIENLKKTQYYLKDIDMTKYAAKTELPLPDHFENILNISHEIIDALLDHNLLKFLQESPDPEKIDLFDSVFAGHIKDKFIQLGIIKTESGVPSFEGFDKIEGIKLNGDYQVWIKYFNKFDEINETFFKQDYLKYIDRLVDTIHLLIKSNTFNEYLFVSLNLLVTTIQQLVLIELSVVSYIARIVAQIEKSIKMYTKSLDTSDILLTS